MDALGGVESVENSALDKDDDVSGGDDDNDDDDDDDEGEYGLD